MIHQYEYTPKDYVLEDAGSSSASLKLKTTDEALEQPFEFQFEAVRPNIFRTTFTSKSHPTPPFPSAPQLKASSESAAKVTADAGKKTATVQNGTAKAVVEWTHAPVVTLYLDGVEKPVFQDLGFRSYSVDGTGVAHYSSYKLDSIYVGLGEKAGPMNLAGRGFTITASDTFGYDAYKTDPLYKHIPFLVHLSPNAVVGIFSTSHSRGQWNIGSEIDGMWGRFKVYRQAHGGLEQYLIVGRTAEEVVRSYAEIVGFPLLTPRYMMGYISGGMKYSMEDEPVRAVDVVLGFLDNCKKHDIPVSVHQMSSGYTVAEVEPKTRNVFTWNRHRFPDPREYTREAHRRGVRILANIKPYVLATHPEYQKLVQDGAFFQDTVTKKTAVARLWSAGGGESGEGSHLDFTSKAGYDWWYQGCKALREVGIDAMWNDNNEYNTPSDTWQCAIQTVEPPAGEDRKHIGLWGRALHTELMGKSSHDACVDVVPDERPLVLTRSATAGTMRYAACSWSGDNVTSWEGMKGGNGMALNAGFSLLQTYGHDIGGFEGPQPTPEHLVRWIQLGIHSPRFTINCYKTSPEDNLIGEVIEPWMHPSVTPNIREAIKRRYELIPYTYSQALKSHLSALPPQRWTGWGYESDPVVWTKDVTDSDTQYWFGDALLIAGVYEPGKDSARVYLPKKEGDFGFLNVNAPFEYRASGQWHEISSTWHSHIPVLARIGSAVPVGKNIHTTARIDAAEDAEFPDQPRDDWRGIEIFPPPAHGEHKGVAAEFESDWLEDDGISSKAKSELARAKIVYTVGKTPEEPIGVKVVVTKDGKWEPLWLPGGVDIILPIGEDREVKALDAGAKVTDKIRDVKGRRVWNVTLSSA
ncbi:family 31 glycosyl hydrolase [Thozetella sp. PMI_491]|nr:family 31 glycosyl hydrolase [Thozetella sp. PMI_491]